MTIWYKLSLHIAFADVDDKPVEPPIGNTIEFLIWLGERLRDQSGPIRTMVSDADLRKL